MAIKAELLQDMDDFPGDRQLDDGVYDITGIKFYLVKEEEDEIEAYKNFLKQYPECCIGMAYETYTVILLEKRPKEINPDDIIGAPLNYGATTIIQNCPKTILLLAEND